MTWRKDEAFRIGGVTWVRDGVLVLAGIFFIVASMELCLGFVLETAGNRRMFLLLMSSTHTAPSFPASHPTPPVGGWEYTRC